MRYTERLTITGKGSNISLPLNTPIKFESKKNYEVCLLSLNMFNDIPNVSPKNNKFKYSNNINNKDIICKTIVLPVGSYRARQRILALLVQRQRVVGGFPRRSRVALLALVQPRRRRKLSLVLILVAIQALRIRQFVYGLFLRRLVALRAFHLVVRHHQGEPGPRMFGSRVRRRLPALHRVAAFALASIRPFQELPAMLILVAIAAKLVFDRLLEIRGLVARNATYILVLAQQGKRRLGVVELRFKP